VWQHARGAAAEVKNRAELIQRAIRRGQRSSELTGGKPAALDELGNAGRADARAQPSWRYRLPSDATGPAPANAGQRVPELARSLGSPADCESC
jgi:hypothetical protein